MTYFATCFTAAARFQQGRCSIETTRNQSCGLRHRNRDALASERRIGSSRSKREARRLIRVEDHDAVSRFFSMLFDKPVDPEPRCMLVEAIPMRTSAIGILDICKHSETLWNLQLLELLRASVEICNLNYNAAISVATQLL